jgi:hypothetical protein
MNPNDSHLSTGPKQRPSEGPVKQHHRLAMGEKVAGTSNPEGSKAPTDNRIGNNQGKTY